MRRGGPNMPTKCSERMMEPGLMCRFLPLKETARSCTSLQTNPPKRFVWYGKDVQTHAESHPCCPPYHAGQVWSSRISETTLSQLAGSPWSRWLRRPRMSSKFFGTMPSRQGFAWTKPLSRPSTEYKEFEPQGPTRPSGRFSKIVSPCTSPLEGDGLQIVSWIARALLCRSHPLLHQIGHYFRYISRNASYVCL